MNKISFAVALLLFASLASAQSSATDASTTQTSVIKDAGSLNKKFQENNEITDAKLKADSGSLSRFSMKFNLTYTGPTMGDLSAADQPNPNGSIGSFQTALGGSMGLRYRLSSKSSVGVSTGIKAIHPFHGMERTDMSNPALTYDYSMRVWDVQMKNAPGLVYRTVPEFKKIGQYGMIYDNHSIVYDIGRGGFAVGVDMAAGYFLYEKEYESKDGKAPRYTLEFNPNIKYNFSDKLSFVTSSNLAFWNPRARTDNFALLNKSINQKVGMGWAINRDLYLNPYFTFYPSYMTWESVTMNVSTIFNVF